MTSIPFHRAAAALAIVALFGLGGIQTGTAHGLSPGLAELGSGDAASVAPALPLGASTTTQQAPATPAPTLAQGAGGIRIEPAAPWTKVGGQAPTNEFTYHCDSPADGITFQVVNDDPVIYGCPIRIYDGTFHFGSPKLAVNPRDTAQAAFFTLHDAPDGDGSTDQSRIGQTHTTFTTSNRGIQWQDQPIRGGPTGASLGDHSAGTMDWDGNLYIAYGWHDQTGPDEWDGSIGLFKAATTKDMSTVLRAYEDPYYILAREIGNPIRSLDIHYVPPPQPDDQPLADYNETQAPSSEDDFGDEAVEINRTDAVVVSWHEKANDWRNASTGLSGWIDFSWSSTNASQSWGRLTTDQVVGPCFDASNSVVWDGEVYVACVVDKGYKHRTRARVGDVDIWKFDPHTATTSYVGHTGLNGPNPRLAAAPDGAMAVTTTKVVDVQDVEVNVAFGWYGRQWNAFGADMGPLFHSFAGGLDVRSAHVTGVAITEDQHTLYLVYKEWNEPDPDRYLPDPSSLNGDPPRLHDYRKVMVAMNSCEVLLAAAMELGQGIDVASYGAYMEHPGLFNDVSDGLQYVREPNGQEMVYFAVNDYGAMQFGAIVDGAIGQPCPNFPVPLPTIPPPPVPAALGVGSGVTYGASAAVGAASLAMVGYLLAAKRRAPSVVAAEAK